MNEGPLGRGNMIETTDSLEAISVFRGWKNFFFVIALLCLLLIQAGFWLVSLDLIEMDESLQAGAIAPETYVRAATAPAVEAAADANEPAAAPQAKSAVGADLLDKVDFGHVARTIGLVNGVLLVTAGLYFVAMFFSLMVSLTGRLGGISHISRAFFLSVMVLLLSIPWQTLLQSRVVGVIYTPSELLDWLAIRDESTLNMVLYYLRFSGYWLVVLLMLLISQVRSARWTKAILHRLEII
jgi:hypothetical protein